MALRCGGFRSLEYLQRDATVLRPQLVGQFDDPLGLEPAAFAHRDQQRALDIAEDTVGLAVKTGIDIGKRNAPLQERALMRVPDAAIAHRGAAALVEGDSARDTGRTPAVAEDRAAALVDVVPAQAGVRHALDRPSTP